MHLLRRRVATLVATSAVMLIAAAPAAAVEQVQVVHETTGLACSSASSTAGGCPAHAVGVFDLRLDLGVFGELHEFTCNVEASMRFGGSGSFWIDGLEHDTGPEANCATLVVECKLPWQGAGEEDLEVGVLHSSVVWCWDPSEGDVCQGALNFDLVEQSGEHLATQVVGASVGLCEIDAELELESSSIHVNHP